jgi:Gpi18-like mannosyltransferase
MVYDFSSVSIVDETIWSIYILTELDRLRLLTISTGYPAMIDSFALALLCLLTTKMKPPAPPT